jgi:ADP-ribose pyrophosphatase
MLVEHPHSVTIVAVDRDDVVVVRQRRRGAPEPVVELPAGKLEPGESPLAAAERELAEECALTAASFREIGSFWAVPAYSTEVVHVVAAEGLADCPGGEEAIEVERRPLAEGLAVVDDAVSLAALALWRERSATD